MNLISIIVSIVIPLIVVGYIVMDLWSKTPAKIPQMSYDKEIDDINHDSLPNDGDRLSQFDILENSKYMVNNYANVLSK